MSSKDARKTRRARAQEVEQRMRIEIGPRMDQVSPVAYWLEHGRFRTEDEARGALELAYQQGMDGMGPSTREWMGLTPVEFSAWIGSGTVPRFSPESPGSRGSSALVAARRRVAAARYGVAADVMLPALLMEAARLAREIDPNADVNAFVANARDAWDSDARR